MPPADLGARELPLVRVAPQYLVRISKYNKNEPYYGSSAQNRFDDPAGQFGTCYCALSFEGAFAESVLHDEAPGPDGYFRIAAAELRKRYVWQFEPGPEFLVADFAGPALNPLDLDGRISSCEDYVLTQAWAAAVHAHSNPAPVAGMRYVSRLCNTGFAVVLFKDRVTLKPCAPLRLPLHREFHRVMATFQVKSLGKARAKSES